MDNNKTSLAAVGYTTLTLGACALLGGCDASSAPPAEATLEPDTIDTITQAYSSTAATSTANTHPKCTSVSADTPNWYAEIGNGSSVLWSYQRGIGVNESLSVPLASASKWVYAGARIQGLTSAAIATAAPFLNFTSGWRDNGGTPAMSCTTALNCWNLNGVNWVANSNFNYNGGHMLQDEKSRYPAYTPSQFVGSAGAGWVNQSLGLAFWPAGTSAYPAGGYQASPINYRMYLQKILNNQVTMGSYLGAHAVCTSQSSPCYATYSPASASHPTWMYSLGHWVESDQKASPAMDTPYSSPGMFGFYPAVIKGSTNLYQVLSRVAANGTDSNGLKSAECAYRIRWAFINGVVPSF